MAGQAVSVQKRKKIVVIGAGIVGVSTAIWLQRDGHDVVLIDRLEPGEATSYGNGGVLASCAIVPVTGPGLLAKAPVMLFDRNKPLFLKWRYLPRLLPWLAKYLKHNNEADTRRISQALCGIIGDSLEEHQALAKGTGAEKYVRPSDYLFVYRNRADFEAEALAWDIRRKNGFKWKELDRVELSDRVPSISAEMEFGIVLGDHGWISDPGAYVKVLAKYFTASGGAFFRGEVQDIRKEDGRITGVVLKDREISCDKAVLAAGVWSKGLMEMLGAKVPMESERGYHVEYWAPSSAPELPMMISSGKFVVTPMEGRIRTAGVLEFGGLDAGPSQAPFELLERQFRQAFPGITFERTERWMGHRPAPSDSIPVIGEVKSCDGVYAGFGHHHVGLTGGPKTGRLLAQLIDGKKPNLDLAPYSPMRFH